MNALTKKSLAVAAVAIAMTGCAFAQGAAPACEPAKLAQKYPSLVGKTFKIGVDPQTPPYVMRDAKDFNKLVGFDVDLSREVLGPDGHPNSSTCGHLKLLHPERGVTTG